MYVKKFLRHFFAVDTKVPAEHPKWATPDFKSMDRFKNFHQYLLYKQKLQKPKRQTYVSDFCKMPLYTVVE